MPAPVFGGNLTPSELENAPFSHTFTITNVQNPATDVTFSILNGDTIANFALAHSGGDVFGISGTTPDAETQLDTTIAVTAVDTTDGATTTQNIVLRATNIPEPVADTPAVTVTTGQTFTVVFTKFGPHDSFTQRVDGVEDTVNFTSVTQGADKIAVTGSLDILDGASRTLTLVVTRSGFEYTADATITVQDVPAPAFTGATSLTSSENLPILLSHTITNADTVTVTSDQTAAFDATGQPLTITNTSGDVWDTTGIVPDAETITSANITLTATGPGGTRSLIIAVTIRNVPEPSGPTTATTPSLAVLVLDYDKNGPHDSFSVLRNEQIDPNVTAATQGADGIRVTALLDLANGSEQTITLDIVRNGVSYPISTVVTVTAQSAPGIVGASAIDNNENLSIAEVYAITGATSVSFTTDMPTESNTDLIDNLDGTHTLLFAMPDADTATAYNATITATNGGGSTVFPIAITSRNIPEPTVDFPTLTVQDGEEFTLRVTVDGPTQSERVEPTNFVITQPGGPNTREVTGSLSAANGAVQTVTVFFDNLGIEYPVTSTVTVESETLPVIVADATTRTVQSGVPFTVTFTKNAPVDSLSVNLAGFTIVETDFSVSVTGSLDILDGVTQALILTATVGAETTTATTTMTVTSDVVLSPVIYAPTSYTVIEGIDFGFDVQINNFVSPVVSGVAGATIAPSTAGSRLDIEFQVLIPAQTGARTFVITITDNNVSEDVTITVVANSAPVITAPTQITGSAGQDLVINFETDSFYHAPQTNVGYIIERDQPVGLYSLLPLVVTGFDDDRNFRSDYWLRGNAYRAGTWNVIEVADGVYDFTYLNWIVQESVNVNKAFSWLQLVDPDGWPDFIINDPEIETWVDPLDGLTKPIPWNAKLLQRWRDFNVAVSNALVPNVGGGTIRLADHPLFTLLHPIFPGWPRNAMRDGIGSGGTTPVSSLPGFTRANMQTSIVYCMDLAVELFPRQILNLSLWNIQDGSTNPDLWEDARATILSYPKATLFQDNLLFGTDQPGGEYIFGPNPDGQGEVFKNPNNPDGISGFNGFQHLAAWVTHSPDRNDRLIIGTVMEGVRNADLEYNARYHELYIDDIVYGTTEAEAVTWLKELTQRWELHIPGNLIVDGQPLNVTITADEDGHAAVTQTLQIVTDGVEIIPVTVTIPTASGGPTSYTLTVALNSIYNNLNLVATDNDGNIVAGAASLTGTVNTAQAGVYVQTVVVNTGFSLVAPVSLIITVQDEPDQIPDIRGGVDIVNIYSPYARVFLTRDNRFIFAVDFEGDFIDFTNATRMELLDRSGALITDDLTAINVVENGATIEAVEVHLPPGSYSRYPIALTFVVYDAAHTNGQIVTHWRDERLIMRVIDG